MLCACHLHADDAKVLPKNRWRLRLVTGFVSADSEFSNNGSITSFGAPFSRPLNARLLNAVNPEPQLSTFVQLKNTLSPGSGDALLDETIAELDTAIETSIISNTVVAEYGLTDRLSIGVILPVIYGESSVKSNSTTSEDFAQQAQSLPSGHPEKLLRSKLIAATTVQAINSILTTKYNYSKGLNSWSGVGLGDLEVGAKYNYFKSTNILMTGKAGFRAPTGRTDDPDQLTDIGFGDGEWDFGFFHLANFTASPQLYFTTEIGYTVQLPSESQVRIPLSADLPIGPASKVDFDRGDFWEASLTANLSPLKTITVSPKYRYKNKFKDEYSRVDSSKKTLLESNTNQSLHEGELSIEYSNLSFVRSGQSKLPYGVVAYYRQPLAATNTSDYRAGGLQLKTYF